MEPYQISKTANRQVLGSMRDFAWMLGAERGGSMSLLELSLDLASSPCSPLGMNSPDASTSDLFKRPKLGLL